jgi:hypothetical protein
MSIWIIRFANFAQWHAKDVAQRNALADVQVPERIKMDTPWLAQILVRAPGELRPGPLDGFGGEFLGSSPAIHDNGFTRRELADR